MYPTLLSLGPFHFHSYAVFLSAGFLTAVLLIVRDNYRQPNPYPITPIGGLWVFLGGLFGARLYYIVQYGDPARWFEASYLWSGGLVFYGGALGGALGAIVYLLIVRAPIVPVGDLALSYVPLAHAIARVGCFLNGCCWGATTQMPWGVTFPTPTLPWRQHLDEGLLASGATRSLPVHPSQLYESGSLLIIFFILRYFYRRPHPQGSIMLGYLFCYGAARIVVEAFRGDSARHVLNMTVSQYVALGMMATALTLALLLRFTFWRAYFSGAVNLESADSTAEPASPEPKALDSTP
ncbi:MAG: Prolipoprotein diacylglyceryl transferase [Candidatus Hydrogenedentota bacterium]|jgi:phosphatidylglycerol:prolipoprotein diacylglycerol transferase